MRQRCAAILATYEDDPEAGHKAEAALKEAALRWLARPESSASDRARVVAILARMTRKSRGKKWYA